MRQGQQNRRGRGRNNNQGHSHNVGSQGGNQNNNRRPQNPLSRNYESNGPGVKIRGNAAHVAEKYMSLARDAITSGDNVMAENYLQHAEHYNRIIMSAQQPGDTANGGMPRQRPAEFGLPDLDMDGEGEGVQPTPPAAFGGSNGAPHASSGPSGGGSENQQGRNGLNGHGPQHQQPGFGHQNRSGYGNRDNNRPDGNRAEQNRGERFPRDRDGRDRDGGQPRMGQRHEQRADQRADQRWEGGRSDQGRSEGRPDQGRHEQPPHRGEHARHDSQRHDQPRQEQPRQDQPRHEQSRREPRRDDLGRQPQPMVEPVTAAASFAVQPMPPSQPMHPQAMPVFVQPPVPEPVREPTGVLPGFEVENAVPPDRSLAAPHGEALPEPPFRRERAERAPRPAVGEEGYRAPRRRRATAPVLPNDGLPVATVPGESAASSSDSEAVPRRKAELDDTTE